MGAGRQGAGRNSSPCPPGCSASAATTAFLFPGDMAPGLMSSSLQRTRLPGTKVTPRQVWVRAGVPTQGQHSTSWCPQPGQGWSESAISFFSSLPLGQQVPEFLQTMENLRRRGEKGRERREEDEHVGRPLPHGTRVVNIWREANGLVPRIFHISPAKIQTCIFWALSAPFHQTLNDPDLGVGYFV